jgi:hypothetical protein
VRTKLAVAMLSLLLVPSSHPDDISKHCVGLDDPPPKAETMLPMVSLTDADIKEIERKRACYKGYLYPGGEDALTKASSLEIRTDLQHLQDLFDKTPENTEVLSQNDQKRIAKIKSGWDREQVLLWGNAALIRKLSKEGQWGQILIDSARVRKEFGLRIEPLTSWDKAQQATYFSPQALRNIISAWEYGAKGNLTPQSGPERDALVKAYLADEPALAPTMMFHHSAAREVLKPVCVAAAPVGD